MKMKKSSRSSHSASLDGRFWAKRAATLARRGFVIGMVFTTLAGCTNIIRRGQSPDDQIIKIEDRKTTGVFIGDACQVMGFDYAKIEGIGMVTGLEGTGSSTPPSGQRDYLISELESKNLDPDPRQALASPNTSMVLIQAKLPPGIKKGERIDIYVETMPKSETSSLRYGRLLRTQMRPMLPTGRSVKLGNVTAVANGTVMVDSLFETRKDKSMQTRGWILGGGVAMKDRPLQLVVALSESKVKVTRAIAYALNDRFSSVTDRGGREDVANPLTDRKIELVVPNVYEKNVGRFVQVLAYLAYSEPADDRVNRLDRLDRQIADEQTCATASLELEAIGDEAIPVLRRALKHPKMKVRFYAAQALAYMQQEDGIDDLLAVAENEPIFRWHAIRALMSLEGSDSKQALTQLLDSDSAETRYGAFRALQTVAPNDPIVEGAWLADEFHLHVVPTGGPNLLHLSRSKRPEIVLFGEEQRVSDEFLHVETGLTIRGMGDGKIRITRYLADLEPQHLTCSTRLVDLIGELADLGFDYTTMVNMLINAKQERMLETRLAVNAVPRAQQQKGVAMTSDDEFSEGKEAISIPTDLTDQKQDRDSQPAITHATNPPGSNSEDASNGRPKGVLTRFSDWMKR